MTTVERIELEADGLRRVGNVHLPDSPDPALPGLVLTGPFTGVKEQVVGTYAQGLADAGFAALAFDRGCAVAGVAGAYNSPAPFSAGMGAEAYRRAPAGFLVAPRTSGCPRSPRTGVRRPWTR